jgi:hypothetical protein
MLEFAYLTGKIMRYMFDLLFLFLIFYFIVCFPFLIYSLIKKGPIKTIKILIK